DRCLAGASRHCQENASFAGNDCFDGAVDRDLLIISLTLFEREVDRCKKLLDLRVIGERLAFAESLPEIFRRWIIVDPAFFTGEVIELDNLRTVSRIGELKSEHLRVPLCLLKPLC